MFFSIATSAAWQGWLGIDVMDITAWPSAGAAPDGQINPIDFGWLVSASGLWGSQSGDRKVAAPKS
jgi:hypothetical protein